ncbi:Spermatid maturation protein 1 [Myotis brandtii]|uniref:Spermatid maturation protein 1 n=2 Tax=Myotis brandtii TaxID=109478 RepID=S7NE61_MYOBR|nr:Spermatid maturation protein 1 [Myotis brandtii]
MDPVKMTVTPRPTRRQRHRGWSARRAHHPTAWAPDTDDEERHPHRHTAICSQDWDHPSDWDGFQSAQGYWDPWAQDTAGLPTQGIRFQEAVERRPLKREMQSEMSLEAYVYPVNPPPHSPQCHKNNGGRAGAEGGQEQCSPDPPAPKGPAVVPDIPQRHPSRHLVYDALDVRRRLRELTQEVEFLAHCYPMATRSSTAEGANKDKDWVYRPLTER